MEKAKNTSAQRRSLSSRPVFSIYTLLSMELLKGSLLSVLYFEEMRMHVLKDKLEIQERHCEPVKQLTKSCHFLFSQDKRCQSHLCPFQKLVQLRSITYIRQEQNFNQSEKRKRDHCSQQMPQTSRTGLAPILHGSRSRKDHEKGLKSDYLNQKSI